ncbi:hypothetical protein [Amycolatopsis sp. Hca4]|uniref:hypothetical protein n=1 Tax=Amycolatopsis sp. Hca4 TaxID=2742131 RepID=UPI00158FD8CF|nr:hypothetical protein [Amycolatopsis sp. Hca4]QKV74181.1 hypothetical protein HUT10_10695 [Amycolatopsis sp. Hca4]
MSIDEIKALIAALITVFTQVINHIDPQTGALFSVAAPLVVALVIIGREED